MTPDSVVDLLWKANRLKTVPRTGWTQKGVADPETVAAHSHGVALVALLLLEMIDTPCERADVLAMAVLHDLPESVTGDLPRGASRLLPAGVKATAERAALEELVGRLDCAPRWREWLERYMANASPEARLVKDADKLDLLLQALFYERTTGNRELDDYWDSVPDTALHFAASRGLAAALRARRPPV